MVGDPQGKGARAPQRRSALEEVARAYRRQRSGDLTHDVSLFTLLLRHAGVPVSVASVLRAMRALTLVSLDNRHDVHVTLRCCLTAGIEEAKILDIVFPVFWSVELAEIVGMVEDTGEEGDDGPPGRQPESMQGEQTTRGGQTVEGSARFATYSRSGRDEKPASVPQAHTKDIDELARQLVRALGTARSRRTRVGDTGETIDLRDSLRHNLRFGEEMLTLRCSYQRDERTRLAILCDVSSSMRPYTPLFLAFVYSLTKFVRSVESAIFNVETTFVTDVFRRSSLGQALAWLEGRSVSLAGGTKTGHCLHMFNASLERRGVLRSKTTALILSDGWDVGDAELLERETYRLRSQIGRLVWLDPHAAAASYHPQVRGLQVVWPYIDDYLDFSSIDSLTDLITRVEGSPTRSRSTTRRHAQSNA